MKCYSLLSILFYPDYIQLNMYVSHFVLPSQCYILFGKYLLYKIYNYITYVWALNAYVNCKNYVWCGRLQTPADELGRKCTDN